MSITPSLAHLAQLHSRRTNDGGTIPVRCEKGRKCTMGEHRQLSLGVGFTRSKLWDEEFTRLIHLLSEFAVWFDIIIVVHFRGFWCTTFGETNVRGVGIFILTSDKWEWTTQKWQCAKSRIKAPLRCPKRTVHYARRRHFGHFNKDLKGAVHRHFGHFGLRRRYGNIYNHRYF